MLANRPSHDSAGRLATRVPFTIGKRLTALIYILLGVAAVIPLCVTNVPLLVDFPNHLARIHIMANVAQDAALSSNYDVRWGVVPNLAFDIFALPFYGLLPAETVGRLFILMIFALLVGGTLALRRVVYGRVDLWTTAVFLFLYNHVLIMGFLNYLFGLGLVLFLFAGWIASRSLPPAIRVFLFSTAAIVLFFCHVFALVVYAISVGSYEIGMRYRDLREGWLDVARHWLFGAMQFVPVVILVLATMPDAQGGELVYGTFVQKLRAAWSPTLTYQKPVDLALMAFVVGVLAVGLMRRRFGLVPQLRGPLLVLALLAVVMPFWVRGAWGSVAYSDLRLPLAVALLLVAGLKLRDVKRETLFALGCAAAVLFGARIIDMTMEWRRTDRELSEFRAATTVIPKGVAVLPVQVRNAHFKTGVPRFEYAYWHLAALAVIDRSVFMPFLFTDPAKQPVRASAARKAIDAPFGAPLDYKLLQAGMEGRARQPDDGGDIYTDRPFWSDWPARYDYLLLTHFGVRDNPAPSILEPVHEGSFFTIFRIIAPPAR